MNDNFQAKQIHIIHMESAKYKPYFAVNNNELTEIMRNQTNIWYNIFSEVWYLQAPPLKKIL